MAFHKSVAEAAPDPTAKRPPAGLTYIGVYRASPLERIDMIKQGLRTTEARRILAGSAMGQGVALKALNLSPATINKKARQDQTLSRVIVQSRLTKAAISAP